ncbi:hypothetical protein HY249_03120, partial [Candidatus Azambacteria bacterium]|nr:hypothetical protein [Candidatus Azambacteria bacterium]
QLNESIKSLNIDSASTQVGKLHQIDAQLAAIQRLRSGHTDAAKIMNAVAKSVHPNVYYEKGDFDLKKNIVDLGGVAGNPTSLASQVGIYTNSKEISEYKVSNVSLNSSDGSVKFSAVLNIKL